MAQISVRGLLLITTPAACCPICLNCPSNSIAYCKFGYSFIAIFGYSNTSLIKVSSRVKEALESPPDLSIIAFLTFSRTGNGILKTLPTSSMADLPLNTENVGRFPTLSLPYFFSK